MLNDGNVSAAIINAIVGFFNTRIFVLVVLGKSCRMCQFPVFESVGLKGLGNTVRLCFRFVIVCRYATFFICLCLRCFYVSSQKGADDSVMHCTVNNALPYQTIYHWSGSHLCQRSAFSDIYCNFARIQSKNISIWGG